MLGDSVALVRTPGHTEGNHSIVVRTPDGLFVTSENGVCADSYAPQHFRIAGLRDYAKRTGAEVVLNGNTLEGALDQYLSMVLEKEIAGPSKLNPDFPNVAPSSEMSAPPAFARPQADLCRGRAVVRRPRRSSPVSVFITGCASGIGLDLAEALIQRGTPVTAVDIDEDGLHQRAQARGWPSERTLWRGLDVTDPKGWRTAIAEARETLGPIDTLINVAGFLRPGWVHELDVELAARQLEVNIEGVVFGTRYVANDMVKRGKGHIINVASLAALAPVPGLSVYSASKYAVRAFSLAAAQELRPHGIAVTIVCPDAVRTPMLDLQRNRDEAAMTFSGSRELEPAEVTAAILDAMKRKPLQVFLPRHRGWIARAADLLPQSTALLGPLFRRRGLANQRKRRAQ